MLESCGWETGEDGYSAVQTGQTFRLLYCCTLVRKTKNKSREDVELRADQDYSPLPGAFISQLNWNIYQKN